MLKQNRAEARSGTSGLVQSVLIYAILASLWVFISHLSFDIFLRNHPEHERYETLADVLLAVPGALIIFLLLRRELLRRAQVEKDRAASERRLTHVLESASDAIIGLDQDYRIFLFNRGAELVFGYRQAEVCGRPIQSLLPLESVELQHLETPRSGSIPSAAGTHSERRETTARRWDGTAFPAEISVSRLEENGRILLTIVLREVTQRKAAEAALQKLNQELETRVEERINDLRAERVKLTRILDALPDGISVITQDGYIEYLNPALERDFGPVAGRTCHEYLHEQCETCADCPGGIGQNRGIVSGLWHSSKTGKTYERIRLPLASTGGHVARLEILHDVTQRLAAEKERGHLRAEIDTHRRLFQTIVQNATVSIAVYDGVQLRLKWANPSYRDILDERFRNMDITGLRLEEVIPRAAERGLTDLFRAVATSGQPHHDPEYEFAGFNRGVTYWQWSLLPLPAAEQESPDLLLLATEITAMVRERKRVEELRAEAEQRAEELRLAHGQLEGRTRELSALLDLSQQLNSTLELQPIFEVILNQLKITFDYDAAALLVQDGQVMTTVAHRGPLPEERAPWLAPVLEKALDCDAILKRRQPLIVEDLYTDIEVVRHIRSSGNIMSTNPAPVSRSWMAAPMLIKDRIVGLLRLEHLQPGHFSQRHARLALAMANQAAIAIENARLYRAGRRVAALEERQRLARELHDSVSQALYAIALETHTAKEVLGQDSGRLKETLDGILALAESAVSEMRFLIFELRPDYLENEGLSTTLARLADAVHNRYGCDVRLDLRQETSLTLDLKEALYRICHEALTNTARHAHAGVATIRIREEEDQVVLAVEDDGIGFEPRGTFPGHLGLQSMRERAAELGGVLEVESGPGKGTLVRARFPLAASQSGAPPEHSDQA